MGKLQDLTGQKFGTLTVIKEVGHRKVLCKCDCGSVHEYFKYNLIRGATTTCRDCSYKNRSSVNIKDMTGEKFGTLTVIKELGHRKVLCKCDCGSVREYFKYNLTRGITTTCRDCSYKNRLSIKDTTGKRFGKLVVIKELGRGKVLCKCDCGSVREYFKYNLTRGLTTVCRSCSYKNRPSYNVKDMTGKKFGKLVVIKELGRGRVLCQCECGNQKEINKGHLLNGDIVSCGCTLRETGTKNMAPYFFDKTMIAKIRSNKASKRSTTGIKGVSFHKSRGRFSASIGCQGKKIYLGTFKTLEEAVAARKAAEEKYYKPLIDSFEKKSKDTKKDEQD